MPVGQPGTGTRCAAHKCTSTDTEFIKLHWFCARHAPDETPAVNCGHINTCTVAPRVICSWCGGTLRRLD